MICVSIGRGRHRHMIAEFHHLVDEGAQLVELRLDYINGEVNLKRLLNDRPCPVIVTCRREQDGGMWKGSEKNRQLLLRTAVAEGVEYVDLEEDIAAEIPRFGKTKRIISHHDFAATPGNLDEIHRRLCRLDPDIVKIATMANHWHDNVRILRLIDQSEIPTVGMCMGEIGTPSRILAARLGVPFTYATFHHERTLAPGQLSFSQMTNVYNYDLIRPDTEVFGVIADPIGHSLSPLIHNAAFQHFKMDRVYLSFRIPREDLLEFLTDAPDLGVRGISVTIPHKEAVIRHLTKIDGAVLGIGAANTVIFEGDKSIAYNTDYRAAMNSFDQTMGFVPGSKQPLSSKTALVLGAGGVAKALVFGLKRRGAMVVIAGRTESRAIELAKQFECQTTTWERRHTVKCDVLINGTPVGMHPNVDETPFDQNHLRPNMIVFDTVYNPEQTLLIKQAREKHCKVISGVDMFVSQAALQFKLFTNQEAPIELMREQIKRATGAAKL